jgi:hypothetical protein
MALRVAVLAVFVALAGPCAFGLWHVVAGGLVAGNERALTFGLVLAVVTGVPLVLLLVAVRRSWGWGRRRSDC